MSSHITSDLEQLADRCGILKRGKLIFLGDKAELINTFSQKRTFEDAVINAFQENGDNGEDVSKELSKMKESKIRWFLRKMKTEAHSEEKDEH